MPIAIDLPKKVCDSFRRAPSVRALNVREIDSVYVECGLFSDSTERLDASTPEFRIDEQMTVSKDEDGARSRLTHVRKPLGDSWKPATNT